MLVSPYPRLESNKEEERSKMAHLVFGEAIVGHAHQHCQIALVLRGLGFGVWGSGLRCSGVRFRA